MIEVTRVVPTTAEQVFHVLENGWLYASWVVGAPRVRSVDQDWPAVGSKLHHSVGLWPLLLDDKTEVLVCRPPHQLTLRARGWPVGEATVDILLEPVACYGCRVVLAEDAFKGPGRLVPKPARYLALRPRNAEALRRLELLAVGMGRQSLSTDDGRHRATDSAAGS